MRFLASTKFNPPPMIRVKRRRAIIDEVRNRIEITETVIELTPPAFWQGLKNAFQKVGEAILNAFGGLVPKAYPV